MAEESRKSLGTGGTRPKTIWGQSSSILHFNDMISDGPGVGVKKLKKLFKKWKKEEFADETVFQQFGYYLAKEATTFVTTKKSKGEAIPETEDGEVLAVSTALQYFSNFLQAVIQLQFDANVDKSSSAFMFFEPFKNLPKGESVPWVKRIRDDIRTVMERDLILQGIPLYLKAKGIGRVIMERLMNALIDGIMPIGSSTESWEKNTEDRFILLTMWLAVGRATEVGLSSWNSAYWSTIHNSLFLNWMELKVSRQKIMNFSNDANSYKLDWFFAGFMYFVSGRGIAGPDDKAQFIFPKLANNEAANAADYISQLLKRYHGVIADVLEDISSKDLRYGPVAIIYLHLFGGLEICSSRGGWMPDDVLDKKAGALVHYLTMIEVQVAQGGRILGGWDDIQKTQVEPKLIAIVTEANKLKIKNFKRHK